MQTKQIDPACIYAPENLEAARSAFTAANPAFAATAHIDTLRQTDYGRLDNTGQIYLDYTGGGLHAASQLQTHMQLIGENVFGNPHSNNPTSLAMTHHVEKARDYVLEYFNADPSQYICVFTSNASGALKIVGESYPFTEGSQYVLTFDNHNSVNGIRMFAKGRGATFTYAPLVAPELRVDTEKLHTILHSADSSKHNLFAFPAQSNFSGVKHDLSLIKFAQQHGWDVLLDCAAFAPTNRCDIGALQPDFATFSFYKMFGYPTGLGCLLMKRDKIRQMRRPWFAGGTITIASVQGDGHYLHEDEAAFEDGTVDYLSIPAVETGLRHIESVGIDSITARVSLLTGYLIEKLTQFHHANGQPLLRILGPENTTERGGTITFTMSDCDGRPIDDRRVEELANKQNISLRTGCFCNPGAGESAHGLGSRHMLQFFANSEPVTFNDLREAFVNQLDIHVSAVRISLGIASNFDDCFKLLAFMESFLDQRVDQIGDLEFVADNCRVIRDTA